MTIEGFDSAFVSGNKEIIVKYEGEGRSFYIKEIGYAAYQEIAIRSIRESKNGGALLVAACVEDDKGNTFSYEQVNRMKKEFFDQFWDAVNDLNQFGADEKKSEPPTNSGAN